MQALKGDYHAHTLVTLTKDNKSVQKYVFALQAANFHFAGVTTFFTYSQQPIRIEHSPRPRYKYEHNCEPKEKGKKKTK